MKKLLKFILLVPTLLVIILSINLTRTSSLFTHIPTTTKTSSGNMGDPINIAFIGEKSEIIKAFISAGWKIPDPINKESTIKIIQATIANSSYPTAPVSNLYLLGRIQDMTFEMPTATVRKRHHVRIWQTNKIISNQSLWIGSASYDSGVELSGTTHLPTHHIDPNIDNEREFLTKSLENTKLIQNIIIERNNFPTIWGTNGGGDWYFDDGNVNVITLK